MSRDTASSVPPIFASPNDREGHETPSPTTPKNPDAGNKAPKRPEDTTPSGDALNDTGEDNQRKKDRKQP